LTGVLPPADEKSLYVNRMFARIAAHYDLLNAVITLGQDRRWRREALSLCDLPPKGRLLDVGTGTGAVARTAHAMYPAAAIFATDFTWEMVQAGQVRGGNAAVFNSVADALKLPFADEEYDAVVSSFLMRNVVDRIAAFREQLRVTRPGGRVVCLETTPPQTVAIGPLFRFYFFRLVPLIGGVISGDGGAYSYLPASTVEFPAPGALAREMELAGLRNVIYRKLMFGSVAIHMGAK
jgi:demethylmenaquinone methyltransferase / 2-methoxy-6-polyprenyl-1,4-benzoquinol methylase